MSYKVCIVVTTEDDELVFETSSFGLGQCIELNNSSSNQNVSCHFNQICHVNNTFYYSVEINYPKYQNGAFSERFVEVICTTLCTIYNCTPPL